MTEVDGLEHLFNFYCGRSCSLINAFIGLEHLFNFYCGRCSDDGYDDDV